MQIVSNIALISINETLVIQLVSFLIFLFIIHRIMIRPLRNVMEERTHHIESIKQDIDDAEGEVESLLGKLKATESVVRAESLEQKKKLEEAGGAEASEIMADIQKEIMELKEIKTREIEAQITEAKKYFQRESELLSMQIMEKVLDRRLN